MSESLEQKLDKFIEAVDARLNKVETRLEPRAGERNISQEDNSLPPHLSHVATSAPPVNGAASREPDLQGDFQVLKDSLSKVRIPAELRLNDSRQGIRRSDEPLLNVVTRCSRYSETGIKLLCTLEPGAVLTQETLDSLFLIHHAQVKYLQEEFAALLVSGQFDTSTSKIFRSLQRNTSGFNQESLETLRSAATLAAAARPVVPQEDRPRRGHTQGYGRGRGRPPFRNDRDVFQTFSNRTFPSQRRQREDNSSATNTDTN